jgi:deoxycytidine triphosphate deaminase
MSVLSNVDLEYELSRAKNIYIYPLDLTKIKGSTYNFKASALAWSLNTKESLVKDGIITIPKNDSAVIVTEEVIWVSNKIGGTYHSKVKLVKKGLGHIGTTLDPTWIGHSVITVHNHSNDKDGVKIKVGETFATLMLYYLNEPSDHIQENPPNQINQLREFLSTEEETNFFEQPWNTSFEGLRNEFLKQDSYKELKKKYSKTINRIKLGAFIVGLLIIWFIAAGVYAHYMDYSYWKAFWLLTITVGLSGGLILSVPYIIKRFKGE